MPTDQRVLGINSRRSVPPEPLARFPLAVCDRTSIDRDDLEYDLNPNAKPRPFNAHYGKPNDAQRWHAGPHPRGAAPGGAACGRAARAPGGDQRRALFLRVRVPTPPGSLLASNGWRAVLPNTVYCGTHSRIGRFAGT